MGMYTELNIEVTVNPEDATTLALLQAMVNGDEATLTLLEEAGKLPDYNLFKVSPRWKWMLRSDSFSFNHVADSSLHDRYAYYDERPEGTELERTLNIRCDLKNYNDDIELFIEWIHTFTLSRGFVGYMRYEENRNPTLIYFWNDQVEYKEVN